ncbi:MAG: hypothetical protein GQ527_12435, partial [Bacteroidales bacterium]|nr:hypothetical protein [Bacteroidales bacterium]
MNCFEIFFVHLSFVKSKMNLFLLLNTEQNNQFTFRVGLIAGFILYAFYGYLDLYMLPDHYQTAWLIRFAFIGPIILLAFGFSYFSWFQQYLEKIIVYVVFLSQIGVFSILFLASANEKAYNFYYVGIILVIYWAAFIFRMKNIMLLLLVISTIITYNIYVFFFQYIDFANISPSEFAIFINNETYLIASSFVAMIGSNFIESYQNKIIKEKARLQVALNKAEESDKIKSSFLSTMSHEIRTPLNGIIGFSNILSEEPEIENRVELTEGINRQGYQLLDVLSSMLEFSELQSAKDLGELEKITFDSLKVFVSSK